MDKKLNNALVYSGWNGLEGRFCVGTALPVVLRRVEKWGMGRCLIKLGLRLNRQTPPSSPPPCVELSRLKTASIGVPVRRWAFSHAAENAEKRSRPSSRPAARPPGPASCLRSVLLIHLSCPHPRRIFRRGDLGKCPLAGYAVAAQQARPGPPPGHPAARPSSAPLRVSILGLEDVRGCGLADAPLVLPTDLVARCARISSQDYPNLRDWFAMVCMVWTMQTNGKPN